MLTSRSSLAAVWFIAGGLLAPLPLHAFSGMRLEDPDKMLQKAIESQRSGNFSSAKMLCRQILDGFPHYVDARNIYARVLSYESRHKEALVQYDSALAYDKTNEDARFGKAQVLAWMERYPESLSILEPLGKGNPANVVYVMELGKVQLWSHNFSDAYANFEKAYQLDSGSVEIMRWAARAALGMERKDEAAKWYGRVLEAIPYDREAQFETTRLSFSAENELQIQFSSESFGPPLNQNHTIFTVDYYRELSSNWKPYVHVSRIRKFDVAETQAGGGIYGMLSYENSVFGQILLSPSATVIPRFDVSGEFSEVLMRRLQGTLGFRFLSFKSGQVLVLSPGAAVYVNERFWITGKLYVARTSNGESSLAFLASTAYRLSPDITMRFTGFGGDESFRATTIDEIVAFQSRGVLAGTKIRLNPRFGIDAYYQYTSRSSQSSSHFAGLTLLTYF